MALTILPQYVSAETLATDTVFSPNSFWYTTIPVAQEPGRPSAA